MTARLPKYTAPGDGALSAAMVAAYREAGVLILTDFVSLEACNALRQRTLELIDDFDPSTVDTVFSTQTDEHQADEYFIGSGDKIRFFLEDGAVDDAGQLNTAKEDCLNKIGHAMHDLDPVFDAFSRTPELANAVRSIGFKDPAIIQSMYIFKSPRIGGEVVCQEDATIDNGCMHFIPGGHQSPLRKRNHRYADGSVLDEVLDETPYPMHLRQPAEAPAGSLVIFDGRAPHMSGPNRSEKSRHAYTLHVIDRNCHYPDDNWLQRGDGLPLRGFDS